MRKILIMSGLLAVGMLVNALSMGCGGSPMQLFDGSASFGHVAVDP